VEVCVGLKLPIGLQPVAPTGNAITDYDRAHFQQYVRLLDGYSAGLDDDELCKSILDMDPRPDRNAARRILRSHLERARWISQAGYRQI
jgi:hypothetical protein